MEELNLLKVEVQGGLVVVVIQTILQVLADLIRLVLSILEVAVAVDRAMAQVMVLLVDLEEEQRAWDLIILADHQTKQILLAGQLDLAIREEIKADGRNKPEAEQAEAELAWRASPRRTRRMSSNRLAVPLLRRRSSSWHWCLSPLSPLLPWLLARQCARPWRTCCRSCRSSA